MSEKQLRSNRQADVFLSDASTNKRNAAGSGLCGESASGGTATACGESASGGTATATASGALQPLDAREVYTQGT